MMKPAVSFCVIALALLSFAAPVCSENHPDSVLIEISRKREELPLDVYLCWLFDEGEKYDARKEVRNAWLCYDQYRMGLQGVINRSFLFSSEQQRYKWWEDFKLDLKDIQKFALKYIDQYPALGTLAYDCELFSKSLLLNASNYTRKRIKEMNNPRLLEQWKKVMEQKVEREYYGVYVDDARSDSVFNLIEKKFAEIIYGADESGFNEEINWKDVAASLKEDEALVEYITLQTPGGEFHYAVLVLQLHSDYPQLIYLGSEATIASHMKSGGGFNFEWLYGVLWKPLESYLGRATNIYIAKAGMLNTIPFVGFHDSGEFITDKYTLHNILSGRELVNRKADEGQFTHKAAMLIGGIDFSVNSSTDGLRSTRQQALDFLPGSQQEVENIEEILTAIGWNVQMMTDTVPTEAALRAALKNGSPEILHISTHGFYIPEAIEEPDWETDNAFSAAGNPLMRTGLLLSGANRIWTRKDEKFDPFNDGVFTAYEISNMDLSATRLVVLSACETGLGDIDYSEGVYGLQRAFRLAGVEAMILSMWKISDKDTVEFMTSFYRHLSAGKSVKVAFDTAQEEAKQRNAQNPQSWAGFILIE